MSNYSAATLEADRHMAGIMLESIATIGHGKFQPVPLAEAYELSELAEGKYGTLTFDSRPQPGLRRAIVSALHQDGAVDQAFSDHKLHPLTAKVIAHSFIGELRGVRPLGVYNTLAFNQPLFKTAVTLDLDSTELTDFDKLLPPRPAAIRTGAYLAVLRYLAGEPRSCVKKDIHSNFHAHGERVKAAPYGDKLQHFYPRIPKSMLQSVLDHAGSYNELASYIRPTIYEDGEIAAYLAYGFSPRKTRLQALRQLVDSDYGDSPAFHKRMIHARLTPALLLPEVARSREQPQEVRSIYFAPSSTPPPETTQAPTPKAGQGADPSIGVDKLITRFSRRGYALIHVGRCAQAILAGQPVNEAVRSLGDSTYLSGPLWHMTPAELQEVAARGEESLKIALEAAHDSALQCFEQLIADRPELADRLDKADCLGAAMTAAFQKTFERQREARFSSYGNYMRGVASNQLKKFASRMIREIDQVDATTSTGSSLKSVR